MKLLDSSPSRPQAPTAPARPAGERAATSALRVPVRPAFLQPADVLQAPVSCNPAAGHSGARLQHQRAPLARSSAASPDAGTTRLPGPADAPSVASRRAGVALAPGSGASVSSWSGGARDGGAAGAHSLRIRPVDPEDYWPASDLHCSAFYPRATPFWFAALRVDRVMSLQLGGPGAREAPGRAAWPRAVVWASAWVDPLPLNRPLLLTTPTHTRTHTQTFTAHSPPGAGKERPDLGKFLCLVAEGGSASSGAPSSSGGSSSSSPPSAPPSPAPAPLKSFSNPRGEGATRVDLGPLVDALVALLFPPAMRRNYAATYGAGGLRGVVVVDSFGEHVPRKRKRMSNGTVRCAVEGGEAGGGGRGLQGARGRSAIGRGGEGQAGRWPGRQRGLLPRG
jgi:hypothetical protein